jgi:hypothetical protein
MYHIVGLQLRRELTDMVFDYALGAENIANDIKVYDRKEPDFEKCGADDYA